MARDPLDSLRVRLLHGGYPPRRVNRYVGELRDHRADLVARELAAGATRAQANERAQRMLGDETQLYQAMLDSGAPRSRAATVPWAIFGVLPLIAFLVAFVLSAVATFTLLFPYRELSPSAIPGGVLDLGTLLSVVGSYLLAPTVAAACIVIALRQRVASRWVWVGLGLIALVAAPLGIQIDFAPAGGGIRGSAAFAVLRRGEIDAAATSTLIAIRAAAFFVLSSIAYRLLRRRTNHRDSRGSSSEERHA